MVSALKAGASCVEKKQQMAKVCTKCLIPKESSEFSSGRYWCKDCFREYADKWNEANPGKSRKMIKDWEDKNKAQVRTYRSNWNKLNPDKRLEIYLRSKYGISLIFYNDMLTSQNGCCAICEKPQSDLKRRLCVDHDHACCSGEKSCGKCVRGLLCTTCNRILGIFEDDKKVLLNAIKYLSPNK